MSKIHARTAVDALLRKRYGRSPRADVLATPLTDDEWSDFAGDIPDLERGASAAIATAVDLVFRHRRVYRLEDRRPGRRPRETESAIPSPLRLAREDALTTYLAALVEDDVQDRWGVRKFRQEHLDGSVLPASDAGRWLEDQVLPPASPSPRGNPTGTRAPLLAYVPPGTRVVKFVRTRAHTPLDHLRMIVDRVAAFCGWHPARTTMFVVTGEPPPLSLLSGQVKWKAPVSARSRILLTIDPTCTPEEVMRAYRAFRKVHFPRIRRLSDQHARLAVFAMRHATLPVAEQMKRWNDIPGATPKFVKPSAFRRDCHKARQRLTELQGMVP